MKITAFMTAAGLAVATLGVTATPAEAQRAGWHGRHHDNGRWHGNRWDRNHRWDRGHRAWGYRPGYRNRYAYRAPGRCWTEWGRYGRVRVCR
ncbi:hypothetical protein PQ455_17300 [Sphingomonas naphthae]|uniref:Sulfur globule protein n=1 Tax=Sphingomonas naphthae TaxID=1813468 RepID=A0ABY7TK77_9SPHN|nr:hypothetical protein [Sphingomonas naphthae]WCT73343.1 hypothetical protein PQ455_17300 [Sphingomonas naphthae]